MTGTEYQREAINRRAKSMAIAQPFFQIERTKVHSDLNLEVYDLRRICMVILDEIILQMGGSRQGATIEEILSAVRPLLVASNPHVVGVDADRITSYVLDVLTNERERQAFRIRYQIQEPNGELVWKVAAFKLVDVTESPHDDEIVFNASSEAINFFLSALAVEIEAEQAAKDAARDYFMKRGRFEEATLVADENRKRTIQFRMRILQALAAIERNVRDVSFVDEIIPVLKRAREHLDQRMQIEQAQKDDVETRIDDARGDPLRHLAAMRGIFESSIAYNTALVSDLISAPQRYLNEQTRQKFRARSGWEYPEPMDDVLRVALLSPAQEVWGWIEGNWHLFSGPQLPNLPSLADLSTLLVQDPMHLTEQIAPHGEEIEERAHAKRFSEEEGAGAEALLMRMPNEFRLSEVLNEARSAQLPRGVIALSALRVVQLYDGSDDRLADATGAMLNDPDFCGDDLVVRKASS